MELTLATYTTGSAGTAKKFTVCEVGGEIDVYTAPNLRERLVELADSGAKRIIVDLSGVEFLDSTGLGVLVGALKRANATGGVLHLVCGAERILKIFRITGLHEVFRIFSTVDEAVAGQSA